MASRESPTGWWRHVSPAPDDSRVLGNVRRIARLDEEQLRARSAGERLAYAVTRAAGTTTFAVAHLAWFAVWLALNARVLPRIQPFDPFPFNLLTMTVSLEAIFLSIWILITQNHMTRQADRRAQLDLQINLLAEQESTATLRLVLGIAERLGLEPRKYLDDDGLAEETDIERLVTKMDEAEPDAPQPDPDPA